MSLSQRLSASDHKRSSLSALAKALESPDERHPSRQSLVPVADKYDSAVVLKASHEDGDEGLLRPKGSSYSSGNALSHSSLATTLDRPASSRTGGSSSSSRHSFCLPTPPESVSERRWASGSSFSTSRSLTQKKAKVAGFLSLKEPSAAAFAEMQAQLKEDVRRRGRAIAVPAGKLPQNVPAVNSRWDGLPDHVKQKQKEVKEKGSQGEKDRDRGKEKGKETTGKGKAPIPISIKIEPIGPITYHTLDPRAQGEMPALSFQPGTPEELMPRTPATPSSIQSASELRVPRMLLQRRSVASMSAVSREDAAPWTSTEDVLTREMLSSKQSLPTKTIAPSPVPRRDVAPWDFMEGPPAQPERPATSVGPAPAKKGRKFGLFGKK